MARSPGGAGSGSHDDTEPVAPSHPPTEVASSPTEVASPHAPTETGGIPAAPPRASAEPATDQTVTAGGPAGFIRHGPGVPAAPPAGQTGATAEEVWRSGRLPAPPRSRRRLRRAASGAVTVVLVAAAAVVLFLRFHHAPLHVTGVAITQQTSNGCVVNVTGRITTNGSAGTVSYQWLVQSQAAQPLNQSVVAGQDAVYVNVAIQGQGRGSTARDVTLQVLGPGSGAASAHVALSC
jgi:hypothetical protein